MSYPPVRNQATDLSEAYTLKVARGSYVPYNVGNKDCPTCLDPDFEADHLWTEAVLPYEEKLADLIVEEAVCL